MTLYNTWQKHLMWFFEVRTGESFPVEWWKRGERGNLNCQ